MSKTRKNELSKSTGLANIKRLGILPDYEIDSLYRRLRINAPALAKNQVQPSSLDLRLASYIWRIPASFLPGPGRTVKDVIDKIKMIELSANNEVLLESGAVYIALLQESLDLPKSISAISNPKSSTGRIDVLTRVICDGASSFDSIPAGYKGPLFLEICPQMFPIIVRRGSRLSQVRFRVGDTRLNAEEHRRLQKTDLILHDKDGSIKDAEIGEVVPLTVDLQGATPGSTIAYRAKRHAGAIDVDKTDALDVDAYWDRIAANADKTLYLHPGDFYILASKETIAVPNGYAAEMPTYNSKFGILINNFAGFMDPAFGVNADLTLRSRAVLEVRCYITPFRIEHGQPIATLIYERMRGEPLTPYGAGGLGSNYQGQRLKLSKHFRAP